MKIDYKNILTPLLASIGATKYFTKYSVEAIQNLMAGLSTSLIIIDVWNQYQRSSFWNLHFLHSEINGINPLFNDNACISALITWGLKNLQIYAFPIASVSKVTIASFSALGLWIKSTSILNPAKIDQLLMPSATNFCGQQVPRDAACYWRLLMVLPEGGMYCFMIQIE